MDFLFVLQKKYVYCSYCIGDEYDSLEWYDHNIEPKPTEEELNIKLGEIRKEQMREERNQLLKDCDFRVLIDSNNDKEQWTQYRQELRDFPSIWVEGMPFPTAPQ